MDDDNNNWSDMSEDIAKVAENFKGKMEEENLVDDLKQSFNETVENTSEAIKNLMSTVESVINDEEIKEETKELIKKINMELSNTVKKTGEKILNVYNQDPPNNLEEE
tara:strand:- start:100 stop:423 length:324 start_codon:yes stop_codon:yes gene_type:complete